MSSSSAFSRKSKAITIVPLALISGAWTLSLVSSSAGAAKDDSHALPDGTRVPTRAIEAPASVPIPGVIAPAVPSGSADSVVAGASTSGIPSVALAAYQRGAQIIDSADKGCNIPWELIAAIGRVESDHGRYGGNTLSDKGISKPGIYGPVLDGKNGTAAVQDTDGGQLDKDTVYDRAVGPMQFIPSTWSVVKVDADGDGQRNPQDINDAALATAVYLCSGSDNLGTRHGQETAVYRYNHSHDYVNLVLRIMEAYQQGEYTAVPSGSSGGTLFTPSYSTAIQQRRHAAAVRRSHGGSQTKQGGSTSTGSGSTSTGTSGGTVTGSTGSGSTGGITGSTGGTGTTSGGTTSDLGSTLNGVTGGLTGGGGTSGGTTTTSPSPTPTPDPVSTTLTKTQAIAQCTAQGLVDNPLSSTDAFDKCVYNLTH